MLPIFWEFSRGSSILAVSCWIKEGLQQRKTIHQNHRWLPWTTAQPAHRRCLLWTTFCSSSLEVPINPHTPKPSHPKPPWWASGTTSLPHPHPHLSLDRQQKPSQRRESSSCFLTLLEPPQAWRYFLAGNFLMLTNTSSVEELKSCKTRVAFNAT